MSEQKSMQQEDNNSLETMMSRIFISEQRV